MLSEVRTVVNKLKQNVRNETAKHSKIGGFELKNYIFQYKPFKIQNKTNLKLENVFSALSE